MMPCDIMEDLVNDHSERRSADHIPATMSPVVDVTVAEVVNTVVPDSSIVWRKSMDSVAEVVRFMSPEVTDVLVHDEVPLSRMHSHNLMTIHPVVVIVVVVIGVVVHEAVVDIASWTGVLQSCLLPGRAETLP